MLILCLLPTEALAQRGVGTWESPYIIDSFPFAHRADTTVGVEMADSYDCGAGLDESGPEVVYQIALDRPATVIAWVEGDVEAVVDVDVHVLDDATVLAGDASCLARGHRVAEAEVTSRVGWIVVDTFVDLGDPLTGVFELRVDIAPMARGVTVVERQIARGVLWRQEVHEELFGGPQTVNLLEVDITDPDVIVEPRMADGCETTSSLGERHEAVAAVNGGFFAARCDPVGLVRIDGRTGSTNPADRPPRVVLGLAGPGEARIERVPPGEDFGAVRNAVGGVPQLVNGGVADVTWRVEGAGGAFTSSRHPRTAACVTGDDYLMFVTFDGRTEAGVGVDLYDLADFLVSLGCDRALNYDGGGSTTMWVWPRVGPGVVSYPSNNREADHGGERAVSNAWLIWAPPANRPPRFISTPPAGARVDVELEYDVEATDLDLEQLRFSLVSGPRGMSVDEDEGQLRWTPEAGQVGEHVVVLGALDATTMTEQVFVLTVTDGSEPHR